MKRKLFTHVIIGALMPLWVNAQEAEPTNNLKDAVKTATIETRFTVAYLGKKYNTAIDSNHVLYKIIQEKNLKLKLALASYHNTPAEDQHISSIISRYEEQSEKYLHPLAATGYIKKQIAVLDSIKSLSTEQKKSLYNLFLNRTKVSDDSYKEILKGAMNRVTTDTAYYAAMFKDEINRKANEVAKNYALQRGKPNKAFNSAANYVYQREKNLLTLDYAIPVSNEEKKKLVDKTNIRFKPLIDSALISYGINLPNTKSISTALKYSKALKLSEEQVKTLTSKCIITIRAKQEFLVKNPDGKYDPRPYEREELPKILSQEQYLNLLALQFKEEAFVEAEEKWAQVQKEKLDNGIDGAALKKQLQAYYLNRLIAKERFFNDKQLQVAQVKSIDSVKPKVLKKLEAIQKNDANKEDLKSALMW
ncbi:MAG TPA: hypothetical protein VL125_17125 [Pelobium sp.]|nr:hypothetical protein [Pelobium sp.]